MNVLAAVLTLALLAAVILVVSWPLRGARMLKGAGGHAGEPAESDGPERSELEAAREAKYREIRDAELDYRTGKLSRKDHESVNAGLRREAVEILDRLEAQGEQGNREAPEQVKRQE
jgi:hypothetical protein